MKKLVYLSNLLTLCLIFCSVTGRAQAPVITSGPANATACAGTSTIFTVSLASDTLTTTYMWEYSSDTGATWAPVTDGGLFSGAANDTLTVSATTADAGYQFRVTATNDSGSAVSGVATLTVSPLPVAGSLVGAAAICNGTTTTLLATQPGGLWSSTNNAIATVVAGVVTGVSGGVDTIMYTVTNSCGSASAWHMITVEVPAVAAPVTGPSSVCVGSSIHFTNTNSGGVWSLSNGNATIAATGYATGVAAGMDTVTYTYTNSCNSVVSTAGFTVESSLTAGTISGPSVVCNGSLISLSETEAGGYWISGNAAIATVDASGNVTGRAQGTVAISYMFVNACGTAVTADTITVENPASMITGMDSVGVSMMITLADTAIGGSWSSSDTTIATVDSMTGVVTGIGTGTANITYTVTNICGTSWAMISINVGTAPSAGAITGVDSICRGTSMALTASIPGGVWSASNANASVSDTGLVTGIIGQQFDTINYTVTNAFGSSTVSHRIYINVPPVDSVSGPATIVIGTSYGLYATPAGGVWTSLTPSAIVLIGPSTFVAIAGGNHDLVYTVSNVCGTTTDTFHISLPGGGSNQVNNVTATATGFNVFPNPGAGSFNINLAAALNEDVSVNVTNTVGQVVSRFNIATNKSNAVSLDLASGIYFLNAATATGNYATKITIAR